jgi:leucyl-tRNA synthetase
VEELQRRDAGEPTVQYRLRDWLISRQRYWGPPIPIIHCPSCGPVGVPVEQLPVALPQVADFRPLGTGVSPLATAEEWVNVPCPRCGEPARRETDVSDNFLDSAWYFLRYPSTDFDDRAMDHERTWKWLPVDMYIGGNEHAVLHLMYARFIMRALHALGYVPVAEPFARFRAHGLLIKDGAKMSKNRGNVVNPDEYVARYGADAFRLYLMFLGPYQEGGDFRDDGIRGMTRFVDRVWRAVQLASSAEHVDDQTKERRRHRLISDVDRDISQLSYNTAIAFLMEFARELLHEVEEGKGRRRDAETLLQLLAPFAPHVCEELWERLGHERSIFRARWPDHDARLAAPPEVRIAVQVNGKRRAELTVVAGTPGPELERMARELPRITELLDGKPPRKVITVVDRIVNIVA